MAATFEGYVHGASTKAVLFWGHYWGAPLWFPRSAIDLQDDDGGYVMKVQDWLIKKRGILEFVHYTKEEADAMAQS
jgi:hypothetical protein